MKPGGLFFRYNEPVKNPLFAFPGALAAAALGQFFLAQAGQAWTFWAGLGFYAISVGLFTRLLPPIQAGVPSRPLSRGAETTLFLLTALLAVFFRVYGTNRFPGGVFADRAEVALGGLRILHEHWRPFLEGLSQHVPEVCIYYLAAGWIKLFGSAPEVFSYFDAVLSILGVLGFYWVFRLWVPARTALLAFFFLAVMRWNFVFGHQIYYQCQTVLFMAAALGLLYHSLRKAQWPFAALGGLAAALGLYAYQSFKAFPVLALVLMGYEFLKDRRGFRSQERPWAVFWLVLVLGAAPLLGWMMDKGEVGRREAEVSVFTQMREAGSPAPLWRNLKEAALMFNRTGDTNAQSNIPGHRMLDDITGAFFIIGLGFALRQWRERPFFFALAGLSVMNLPSLFSINGGHAGRMLGTTPFTALLCAMGALQIWEGGWALLPQRPGSGRAFQVSATGVLALAAFLNFHVYFNEQAHDPQCRWDFSWNETTVGRAIAQADPRTEFFLPSRFDGHPTVKFLTYPHWERMHPLDLSGPPQPSAYPPGSSFCFWEEQYNAGALGFLAQCYPGGKVDAFQDPLGQAALYDYRVPAAALAALKPGFPRVQRGLYGTYRTAGNDRPFLERWDPLINFSFRDLPQTSLPLQIHWTGHFRVPKGGNYEFQVVTWPGEGVRILVDGRGNTVFADSTVLPLPLKAGWHRLDLDFQKGDSPIAAVNLLWKRPGQGRYEFIPNDAFGPVKAKASAP